MSKKADVTIEAYCVSCKQKGAMVDPVAVFTDNGRPGVRGTCSHCGAKVFRMGKTELHEGMEAPAPKAKDKAEKTSSKRTKESSKDGKDSKPAAKKTKKKSS